MPYPKGRLHEIGLYVSVSVGRISNVHAQVQPQEAPALMVSEVRHLNSMRKKSLRCRCQVLAQDPRLDAPLGLRALLGKGYPVDYPTLLSFLSALPASLTAINEDFNLYTYL